MLLLEELKDVFPIQTNNSLKKFIEKNLNVWKPLC